MAKEEGQALFEETHRRLGLDMPWDRVPQAERDSLWAPVERAISNDALRRAAGVAQGHKAADPDEWDSADWDQCCDRIATAIRALIKEPGHGD